VSAPRRFIPAFAALLMTVVMAAAELPTPEAHFGFRMGADRQLA